MMHLINAETYSRLQSMTQSRKLDRISTTSDRRGLLKRVDSVLERVYQSPHHGNYRDPTTELFYLLLTVRSRIIDVRPHLQRLKRMCGSWDTLAVMAPEEIEPVIAPLGMGRKRAKLMTLVARRIKRDNGRVSLNFLKKMPIGEAIRYMRSLPYVGEKVSRCVALYSLGADISPMDTHATRVLSRVGVLPREIQPKRAHHWIDRLVPIGSSLRLHVNLVAHGQKVCRANSPACEGCPLSNSCRYAKTLR